MTRIGMLGIVESLEETIGKLQLNAGVTTWAKYDGSESYEETSFDIKAAIVKKWLNRLAPNTLWDLGANKGVFSRLAPQETSLVVSWDFDPSAVEENYRRVKAERDERILPLLADLTNPSPGIGWMHAERRSMIDRGPADTAMALALVHHLALGNNLPFFLLSRTSSPRWHAPPSSNSFPPGIPRRRD